MQAIVKQLLTLTSTSASQQWLQAEAALQPSQLTPNEIADVAQHLATNQQGSEQLWDTLQRATVNQLGSFNREQLSTVFDAMMQTPYEVPDDVGEAVSAAMNVFFEAELQQNLKKDPFFLANVVMKAQAGLGQFAFKYGPGFMSGRPNDEIPETALAKGDTDLSTESNSEVKAAIVQGQLSESEIDTQTKALLSEVQEKLGKNQNVQNVANLK